jgi:hypothetical protein
MPRGVRSENKKKAIGRGEAKEEEKQVERGEDKTSRRRFKRS